MSNGLDRELGAISVALVNLRDGQERIERHLLKKIDEHIDDDRAVQQVNNERHHENSKRLGSIERRLAYYTGALAILALALKFLWH